MILSRIALPKTVVGGISGLLLMTPMALAAPIIDSFQRPTLGPDWEVSFNTAAVRIQSDEYVSLPGGNPPQESLGAFLGAELGTEFSASTSIRLPSSGSMGIAFHIQNSGADFYAFRAYSGSRDLQLIKYTNGNISGLAWYGDALSENLGTGINDYYTVSVTSDTTGTFNFSITDDNSGVTLFTTSFTDTADIHIGGYAGIYIDSQTGVARRFEVDAIPEPGSVALLAVSSVGLFFTRRFCTQGN